MKSIEQWIEEYGESHQNSTNKAIHWICVPLIMLSLLALISIIPFPIHDITLFGIFCHKNSSVYRTAPVYGFPMLGI